MEIGPEKRVAPEFDDGEATRLVEKFSRSYPESNTMKALNEGKGWLIAGEIALLEGHTDIGATLVETGQRWANFLAEKTPYGDEFESIHSAAVRPCIHSFTDDSAEFYRWYEYGGTPRLEPLTKEELDAQLGIVPNAGGRNLAFTAAEWNRFKDWKLGDLRPPIETLQRIILDHGSDEPWWGPARKAADWCHSTKRPNPVEVYDALNALAFRADHSAADIGKGLPAWYQDVMEAKEVIEAAYKSVIEASSTQTSLADAYSRLHEVHALYCKAMAENDAEQATFERFEAAQIEKIFPVLKDLVHFGVDEAPPEITDTSFPGL